MTRPAPIYPRIHMVGDSFTTGLYATAGNEYRTILRSYIQAANPLHASEAWTLIAAAGALMSEQTVALSGVFGAVGNLNYDLLILAIGQNDGGAGHTAEQFRADTVICLDYIQANYPLAQVLVMAIPINPWAYKTTLGDLWNSYNEVLREEAAVRDYWFSDRWAQALSKANLSAPADVPLQATAADTYHPNNGGHLALANAMWADLSVILGQAPRRRGDTHVETVARVETTARTAA